MEKLLTTSDKEIKSSPFSFSKIEDIPTLLEVLKLMEPEFVSQGGNLKDLSFNDLLKIALDDGEVWAAHKEQEIIACFTVTSIEGSNKEWLYFNHGVVHSTKRHKGGRIIEELHNEQMSTINGEKNLVVISVVRSIFLRLGFIEVDLIELNNMDEKIHDIIASKLRPEKDFFIFIKAIRKFKNDEHNFVE